MEFSFHVPLDKLENPPMKKDPVTRKWYMPLVSAYTPEQYALLGAHIEDVLGEDFISFEIVDSPSMETITITYEGHMDGDVEVRRESEMDPLINAWIAQQPQQGGQG